MESVLKKQCQYRPLSTLCTLYVLTRDVRSVIASYLRRADKLMFNIATYTIKQVPRDDSGLMRYAVFGGYINLVKWLFAEKCRMPSYGDNRAGATDLAARGNNKEMLILLVYEMKEPWDESTAYMAAQFGHLDLLKWMISYGCPFDTTLYMAAAQSGDIELLDYVDYMYKHRPDNHLGLNYKVTEVAATRGFWLIVRKLCEIGKNMVSESVMNLAARTLDRELMLYLKSKGYDTVEIPLKLPCTRKISDYITFLMEEGFSFCRTTVQDAALIGNIATVELFMRRDPTVLTRNVYNFAAYGAQLEMLKFLKAHNCPVGKKALFDAARSGNLNVMKWLRENNCVVSAMAWEGAVQCGKREVFQYLEDIGCPKQGTTACDDAACEGLEYLKLAREFGLDWGPKTFSNAVYSGIETLKWLHDQKCPADERLCSEAASIGLELLQWAKKNGYPWNSTTPDHAAYAGHLRTLQWSIGNGCPVNYQSVFCEAAEDGHLHILVWIVEDKQITIEEPHIDFELLIERVKRKGHSRTVKWLEKLKHK